jgi:hypothetical protein
MAQRFTLGNTKEEIHFSRRSRRSSQKRTQVNSSAEMICVSISASGNQREIFFHHGLHGEHGEEHGWFQELAPDFPSFFQGEPAPPSSGGWHGRNFLFNILHNAVTGWCYSYIRNLLLPPWGKAGLGVV